MDSGSAPYVVLARKYRPQSFADLIGQEAMVRTLTNAFATGRIAHAFMLTGVRGVGKTTTARLLARALNYETEAGEKRPSIALDPPGVHCAAIQAGAHPDVMEMDAASHTGVDDIRDILEGVRYAPAQAPRKIYIVDEVHMLSKAAFNALLKTLEEPPAHVTFVFATTEIRKVPVTILSRCQRFDLKRIAPDALVAHLADIAGKEGFAVAEDALRLIARAAEGSARDALSLLDQALVQGAGRREADVPADSPVDAGAVRAMLGLADRARSLDLLAAALAGKSDDALAVTDELIAAGGEASLIARDLLEHCHDITRAQTLGEAASFNDAADHVARVRALAADTPAGRLSRAWQLFLKAHEEVRAAPDPEAALAMALVRIAYASTLPSPDEAARMLAGAAPAQTDAAPSQAPVSPPQPAPVAIAPSGPAEKHTPSAPAPAPTDPRPEPPPADASAPVASEPPTQPPPHDPAKPLDTFAAMAERAMADGDNVLAADLRQYARPVTIQPGKVAFAAADGSHEARVADLAPRLKAALERWTGETWSVLREYEAEGAETTRESEARAKAEAVAAAAHDPAVQKLMAAFPGARVTDVVDDEPEEKSA